MKQGNAIIKRVFVSDIHMGDQRSINPGDPLHAYGWFQNIDKPGGNHPEMFNDFLGNHILKIGSGVGPQEHHDIIYKTFIKCVKQGLRRALWGPKTHF